MQLPHAVEIPGPGAVGIGVAAAAAAQLQQGLQLQGQIERIGAQLHLPQGHREEGLQGQGSADRGEGGGGEIRRRAHSRQTKRNPRASGTSLGKETAGPGAG